MNAPSATPDPDATGGDAPVPSTPAGLSRPAMGPSLFSDVTGSTATDAVVARSRTGTRRTAAAPAAQPAPGSASGDTPALARVAETDAPAPKPLREAAATGDLTVIDTREEYLRAVEAIAAGTGPIAVDAERASGFRYSQRAYLIQVFRRGAGTFLFDPPAVGGFSELDAVVRDVEWVLHAASQDLACLREVGLDPQRIFDTELASRLLGLPRVGLGTVVEELLGIHLAKEHSAADWSTRPLPRAWLVYAALDVEMLVDVRDEIARRLEEQGKTGIAEQEFAATIAKEAKPARVEPWRRLSGLHGVRGGRNLAVAKELWEARDAYAREVDTSPGRLVPDGSLVAVARVLPQTKRDRRGARVLGPREPQRDRPLVGRRGAGPRRDRVPAAARHGRDHAAAEGGGRQGPRRRPPTQARPRRCPGGRDRDGRAAGEPAHARGAASRRVDAARRPRARGRRDGPRVLGCAPLAGRGDGRSGGGGLCRCRPSRRRDRRRGLVGTVNGFGSRPASS